MTSDAPLLQLKNVTKKFGDFTAVHSVNLEIEKGELFCLLGGSGCGKTTLLRMLAGFETPSSGQVLIEGKDMSDVPPYARPTNMMFQSYALFPHMNVEKNIAFGLQQDRIAKAEIRDRVSDILKLVDLSDYGKRKPHQLSGGQRQRVALARALVKQPKLLLLDEPLGALDKKLREQTQFELMNIQDKVGVTFVVVTHDQEEAMTLATRIAVMDKGQFVQIGTPTEIYEFPDNRFVADFVGSANLLTGTVSEKHDGQLTITTDAGVFATTSKLDVSEGTAVHVGIRPEKILMHKGQDQASGENMIHGIVEDIGYLGNASRYKVRVNTGQLMDVSLTNQIRPENRTHQITWDDPVTLSWDRSSIMVLTL